jgi:hypothetical protein
MAERSKNKLARIHGHKIHLVLYIVYCNTEQLFPKVLYICYNNLVVFVFIDATEAISIMELLIIQQPSVVNREECAMTRKVGEHSAARWCPVHANLLYNLWQYLWRNPQTTSLYTNRHQDMHFCVILENTEDSVFVMM